MKLSAIILDYRKRLHISQREFSRRCGLSNSYISFLEKESNPSTGKPMIPNILQYKKIAAGMEMSLQQLFELLDGDAPVDLFPSVSFDSLTEQEQHLIVLWRGADKDARRFAAEMLENHQKKDMSSKAE